MLVRKQSRRRRMRRAIAREITVILLLTTAGVAGYGEMQTSWVQSRLFSSLAQDLDYVLEPGPAATPAPAASGPYDQRLGYAGLDRFTERLQERGFRIEEQARLSEPHVQFIAHGGFPIYREKAQAGLALLDRRDEALFEGRYPERVYADLEAVPPLVVQTLLFIENRELLEQRYPTHNPAIEWDRLARVVPGALAQLVDPSLRVAGGSTLATQIEKFRHAEAGRTAGVRDKLRQMVSASVRVYRDGIDTGVTRGRLIVDYLNATPLGAQVGFGEVLGLGDGLHAWFGTDFEHANRSLRQVPADAAGQLAQAQIYKQVLGLLLAQRRPAFYLRPDGREALRQLADWHLRTLAAHSIIPAKLAHAALPLSIDLLPAQAERTPRSFEAMAASTLRSGLQATLGLPGTYQLDRLDLEVQTTLDRAAQARVVELLRTAADPAAARELGLLGHQLLETGAANDALVLSLTVYERGQGMNLLRVQADNLDGPFDVGRGAKLDLGSTAKLRTLITYLEVVAELHGRLGQVPAADLAVQAKNGIDPLTRWVAEQLLHEPATALAPLLEAALQRRYSASPAEGFFTGGGLHHFANFDKDDNGRVVTVAQAFRNSINLPFIRIMRDILHYYRGLESGAAGDLLGDPAHPLRRPYLERFADREGRAFLSGFYDRYAGLTPDLALTRLADKAGRSARRLAVVFRSVRPEAPQAEFAAFLSARLPEERLSERATADLFAAYGPDRFSLIDRAYLARVHPLELWLVGHLQTEPAATRASIIEASAEERLESYAWLFKTRHRSAQDRRIRILVEEDAFKRIHAAWRRLGYPFDELVPSLASALGSSADRPDALAELAGIILNEGLRQPSVRMLQLRFAADTPFETTFVREVAPAERVMAPEVAALVRAAMADVVENGTARRLHQAFMSDAGTAFVIGAKTGTGDHRRKHFAPGGRLIDAEVVSRSATVVFTVGDAFFGTLTVFVNGKAASGFSFTSSLAAQLLKGLAPALEPLFNGRGAPQTAQAEAAAKS
jgi:membrane peptidoglycan carboxypeptidase